MFVKFFSTPKMEDEYSTSTLIIAVSTGFQAISINETSIVE